VELPVVCGCSSFKPEVGPSGFSIFIELQKSLIFYELTRYFRKHRCQKQDTGINIGQNRFLYQKYIMKNWRRKLGWNQKN